jgi:hypothetical protein
MSTPQNPYGSGDGSGDNNPNGQNPNNQPSAPGQGGDQNSGQQPPQYGSQPQQPNYGQGGSDGSQGYGQQPPQYGSSNDQNQYGQNAGGQDQSQFGSQPQYGQNAGGQDQNQYGSQPQYGQNQDPYGQNQYGQDPYGQNQYDANAQYDANQYGQQPAYAGADGSSDQFIPANPNAAYGQYPSGSGGNTSKNIWGILALIGGIVGVLLSFVFGSGFLFGAAAVVFGFIGLNAVKKGTASNKGFNITGLILGFASVLISIIVVILLIFGIGLLGKAASEEASKSAAAQDPNSQTDPAQDPAQDPSQGSGSSDGGEPAPAQGGEVTIGDDLTATVSVKSGTASSTASGADSTNGQIAVVTMTVKNNSSDDVEMTLSDLSANDGSGKDYDDVFDGKNYRGSLAFTDPVPAGGEKTYEFAFAVESADIDAMHVQLKLNEDHGNGTDFEWKKQ